MNLYFITLFAVAFGLPKFGNSIWNPNLDGKEVFNNIFQDREPNDNDWTMKKETWKNRVFKYLNPFYKEKGVF